MADDPNTEDTLRPVVKNRSLTKGDVPDALKRRYYTDERGGEGLGFFVDARVTSPAFRDRGRELVAARLDRDAIRDMTAIAQHRGWTIVTARGSGEFRRGAWLAGRTIGLEIRGYRPTERDVQELQRLLDPTERKGRRERRVDGQGREPRERKEQEHRREEAGARAQLRVIDAVVRSRVTDPQQRALIMTAARDRIVDWLERGARFNPLSDLDRASKSQERGRDR